MCNVDWIVIAPTAAYVSLGAFALWVGVGYPEGRHRRVDQRISVGPVEASAREKTYPAVPLARDQAVAVMLDLVNPLGADGRLGNSGRNARLDSAGPLRRRLGTPQHALKMASAGPAGKGFGEPARPADRTAAGLRAAPASKAIAATLGSETPGIKLRLRRSTSRNRVAPSPQALLILRARDLRLIYLGRPCLQDAVHGRRNP
jgi:hypothetical protein